MTYGVMLLKIWIEDLLPFSYENMKKLFQFVSKNEDGSAYVGYEN